MNDEDRTLLLTLEHYSCETRKLESAYAQLEKQFYELKQKLETSHQTLEQIISHMSEGLLFVTKQGVITLLNAAAAGMLACQDMHLLNTSYWEQFPDDFFGFSMRESLQTPCMHQRIFLTLNESQEIDVSTSSIPDQGILLLLSDRNEQQKLHKSLNQTERLQELGQMAATLAHEIRNPLGGIEGFAHLLKRDLEEPAHQRMLTAILEGTRTLNQLITNVLDYARPARLHFSSVDLVALIQETLDQARVARLLDSETRCTFETSLTTYPLSLDRDQIKLVLLNILRNSSEAHADKISLVLDERGKLTIQDNGTGISHTSLKKIFTPFFTTKSHGSGLGLAQALAIIKAHEGSLEVSSEEGKGTQFICELRRS